MTFLMLWLTLGLSFLVVCGIDDVVAHVSLDPGDGDEDVPRSPEFVALCLTLVVVAWPAALLEYVQRRS
ncbi:MAG: hypothetical protein EB084_08185 [Proteobacteria bacterium]|nr:hypothetical protein [Pseudomonadota bacterium]